MSRNWSLDSTVLTRAIFSVGLYLRARGKTGGEGETRGSPGTYLSLKSHLCALSILILKGASITVPNLVKLSMKGTTVLLQSAQLCQVLVKINGTAELSCSAQALAAIT